MTPFRPALARSASGAIVCVALCLFASKIGAQTNPVERTFPESKSTVEKALKQLQPVMSGRLPTLEGFAQAGERSLDRYQRGFYQRTAQVKATPEGGSVVRVSARVTAWYADANVSHSGYQLLDSNGRLEADLLDQLADLLSSNSKSGDEQSPVATPPATAPKPTATNEPAISAPASGTGLKGTFSPALSQGLPATEMNYKRQDDAKSPAVGNDLQSEIASLEEALKNQAHPKNLVAVKKSGTAVVASPSLTAKTLFLASAQDEFEMLDYNDDWVHVRVSGLSRGWIWRTDLEMPEGISDVPLAGAPSALTAADIFAISREETAQFPGDWEPLRGKDVKIISVEKVRENAQDAGASAKLEFAKSVMDKSYEELAKSRDLSGLVLIFDSVDGGMIALTLPTLQRWKAGALNDAAMWHQCYFDPPETFTISSVSGSR